MKLYNTWLWGISLLSYGLMITFMALVSIRTKSEGKAESKLWRVMGLIKNISLRMGYFRVFNSLTLTVSVVLVDFFLVLQDFSGAPFTTVKPLV